MYNAIILAGGISKNFSADDVSKNEALLDIGGRPMLSFVLAALEKSKFIDKIFVVGPISKLKYIGFSERVTLVQSKNSIMDTVIAGIQAASKEKPVLVSTTDIPFLTAQAVDDFIGQCVQKQVDLCYPIIAKEIIQSKYMDAKRTYVKLSDGVFTGGNLFFVNPLVIPKCMEIAYKVIDHRKNPFKLATILGWKNLLKFILGSLSSEAAQQRMAEILNIDICVIKSDYAEIGMDVDKIEDLKIAREIFSK